MADPQTQPNSPVPAPPTEWDAYYDSALARAKQQRAASTSQLESLQAHTAQEKALGSEQDVNRQLNETLLGIRKKQLGFLDAWENAKTPEEKAAAEAGIRMAGEALSGQVRPTAGLATMGAGAIKGSSLPAGTLDYYHRPVSADQTYRYFSDRQTGVPVLLPVEAAPTETTTVTTNDEGETTVKRAIKGTATLGPAPANLGGGSHGTTAKDYGKLQYEMFQKGIKLAPKDIRKMGVYLVNNNLELPPTINANDRKSFAGLSNLESTFPTLERYASVLENPKKAIELRKIVESVTNQSKGTGLMAALEWLPGAAIDRAIAGDIGKDPEARGFLVAYNQAREAVQTMRQFAGVSRSTQALYNAMAALLPNPVQTTSAAEAKEQLDALKRQIANIRKAYSLSGSGTSAEPAPTTNQGDSDIPGFIPIK